jgi:hypothetical protein
VGDKTNHHRDTETQRHREEKNSFFTTEDTEITEFQLLFLLRALRVLCGEPDF